MIENIFEKLKKVPAWASVVALIIGAIVSALPIVLNGDVFTQELTETLKGFYETPVQVTVGAGFAYLIAVLVALIDYIIVEGCARIVFQWAVNSRYTNRGKKYFLNVVRLAFGVIKTVIGIYSVIGVFVTSAVFAYIGNALLFVLRTFIITMVYLGIRKECINDIFVFNCYNRLFVVYFIYNGASNLLELFTTVLTAPIDVGYAIYTGVMLLIVALSALALYFTVFKKLKEEQEKARQIVIIPPKKDDNGGNNDEIFKGFGI